MKSRLADRPVEEVRRAQDDELEGYVSEVDDGWRALTVFGGLLAIADSRSVAIGIAHRVGLASLGERWYWWSRRRSEWRVVVPAPPERAERCTRLRGA